MTTTEQDRKLKESPAWLASSGLQASAAGFVSYVTSPSPPVEAPNQPQPDQPQMRTRRTRQA